jgi:DNA-binding GntR family transcriptional regulator
MELTKVVRREPLREQVLASLKEALFNGRLAPGQQLTEEGVAEFLGVSRTPAREALAILFQEGILERRSKGGFSVTIPTKDKIEQIFLVRHLLEPYAARLAASHAKSKDIRRLEEMIAALRGNLDSPDPVDYLEPDRELRRSIFALSRNQQLVDCIGRYENHLNLVAALTLRDPAIRRIGLEVDAPIVKAIAAHDTDSAEAAVHRQLEAGKQALMDVLDQVLPGSGYA